MLSNKSKVLTVLYALDKNGNEQKSFCDSWDDDCKCELCLPDYDERQRYKLHRKKFYHLVSSGQISFDEYFKLGLDNGYLTQAEYDELTKEQETKW